MDQLSPMHGIGLRGVLAFARSLSSAPARTHAAQIFAEQTGLVRMLKIAGCSMCTSPHTCSLRAGRGGPTSAQELGGSLTKQRQPLDLLVYSFQQLFCSPPQ